MWKEALVLTKLSTHCDKPTLHGEEAGFRDEPLMFIVQVGPAEITRCTVEAYDVRVFRWLHSDDRRENWRKALSEERIFPFVVYALH